MSRTLARLFVAVSVSCSPSPDPRSPAPCATAAIPRSCSWARRSSCPTPGASAWTAGATRRTRSARTIPTLRETEIENRYTVSVTRTLGRRVDPGGPGAVQRSHHPQRRRQPVALGPLEPRAPRQLPARHGQRPPRHLALALRRACAPPGAEATGRSTASGPKSTCSRARAPGAVSPACRSRVSWATRAASSARSWAARTAATTSSTTTETRSSPTWPTSDGS